MDEPSRIQRAKTLLEQGSYTCVVITEKDEILTSTLRGVRPLLNWIDEGADTQGAVAADKVVGNGAAFLYVRLGVAQVHGAVMSAPAAATLASFGIAAEVGDLVDHIVNRAGDGLCPMEQAVAGVTDPQEAERAIRNRLAQLADA